MNTNGLKILALLALPAVGGCDLLELKEPVDSGLEDDTGVEQDDTGEALPQPEGVAFVRFVNVADGQELSLSGAYTDNEAYSFDLGAKFFTQGTEYVEIGAGHWLVTMSGGELDASVGLTLEDGAHYTFAGVRDPADPGADAQLLMMQDPLGATQSEHARLRWVNAIAFDGDYVGQVYYNFGTAASEFYREGGNGGTLTLAPHDTETWEYPYAAEPIWIFAQWGVPTELPQVALEVDAFIQAGNNELVNVFLTCTGDCNPEDSFVLGQFEDGSTATTEGCRLYVTGDDNSLTIEEC